MIVPILTQHFVMLSRNLLYTAVTRGNEARYEDFSRQVREEHEAIVAAIRAGDEMAARNAAQTHMFNAARRLSQGQS